MEAEKNGCKTGYIQDIPVRDTKQDRCETGEMRERMHTDSHTKRPITKHQGCRSLPEPMFLGGAGAVIWSGSNSDSTVSILFLRDPKVLLTLIV